MTWVNTNSNTANTVTAPIYQFVDTPLLRVGYRAFEPADGTSAAGVVMLLHGWPDNPATWDRVVPHLVQAGYRVIVPALRGFSPTTFLNDDTPRTGQLAALGRDLVDLIAALGIHRPVLVGHDWGARAVAIACGLVADLASHMVLLSVGYGTNNPSQSISMEQARRYWYHWYMATPRGQAEVAANRRAFAQIMWDTWSPPGWYDAPTFSAAADAFDNPDWLPITLHSYQHRWAHVAGDPAYAADDAALANPPQQAMPALLIHGSADGVSLLPDEKKASQYFTGYYAQRVIEGVGHFPQREAPDTVASLILDFLASNPNR